MEQFSKQRCNCKWQQYGHQPGKADGFALSNIMMALQGVKHILREAEHEDSKHLMTRWQACSSLSSRASPSSPGLHSVANSVSKYRWHGAPPLITCNDLLVYSEVRCCDATFPKRLWPHGTGGRACFRPGKHSTAPKRGLALLEDAT